MIMISFLTNSNYKKLQKGKTKSKRKRNKSKIKKRN